MTTEEYRQQYYQKNRERITEYNKEWAKRNPEKRRIARRKYREKHREEERKRAKRWARNNKEWIREYKRKNREKILRYKREWRKKNIDKAKKYKRKYYEKNRKIILEKSRAYKEKIRTENPEKYKAMIREIGARRLRLRFQVFARDNFTCQYCGRKAPKVELHVDHIYPRAKGGKDKPENYLTACSECNVGKCDAILEEFGKELKS